MIRKALFGAGICILVLRVWPASADAEQSAAIRGIISRPPEGHLYHGVFPGGSTGEEDDITRAGVESYAQAVGKTAAWIYFSHNWYRGRSFPLSTASWVRDMGSIPFIRLMLRSSPEQNRREPVFTLERILQGKLDADLRSWARSARQFGSPLIAEFGTEVNGKWFPWNGFWNGNNQKGTYGDPAFPDGPGRFRDAYRHIIETMRQEGAANILWVFHVNAGDYPQEPWNRFENYYPGDDYIDLLGVSVYGAQTPMADEWPGFREAMDEVYPRLASLSRGKPILVLEFGATRGNPLGDQASWAERALTDLIQSRWSRIIGFSWWNEAWQNDSNPEHDTSMRVQDNPALQAVFRKRVGAQQKVLGRISVP